MSHTLPLRIVRFLGGLVMLGMLGMPVWAGQPITTDSRIKTLVFSPNEVFTITTHYGYQSNIEFDPKNSSTRFQLATALPGRSPQLDAAFSFARRKKCPHQHDRRHQFAGLSV